MLAAEGSAEEYLSFVHCLALGAGPEGAIIWQSWAGKGHQYRFDEHLAHGGATPKGLDEMDTYVDRFEELAQHKVRRPSILSWP